MNNSEKRYLRLTPEHCFDITLADFGQITNNDFMQLEVE